VVVGTNDVQVTVVGTVFEVEKQRSGTEVSVVEGVVRVDAQETGERRLLRAGERWKVPSSDAAAEQVADGEDPVPGELAANGTAEAPGNEERSSRHGIARWMKLEFELADTLLRKRRFDAARHVLYRVIRRTSRASQRARAWLRVADSFESEARFDRAAEAYRRAWTDGGDSAHALNALFALGRVREGRLRDSSGAVAAYRRYLDLAPDGPLASEARRRLCVLDPGSPCGPAR
jgi:TolA-binding protein